MYRGDLIISLPRFSFVDGKRSSVKLFPVQFRNHYFGCFIGNLYKTKTSGTIRVFFSDNPTADNLAEIAKNGGQLFRSGRPGQVTNVQGLYQFLHLSRLNK